MRGLAAAAAAAVVWPPPRVRVGACVVEEVVAVAAAVVVWNMAAGLRVSRLHAVGASASTQENAQAGVGFTQDPALAPKMSLAGDESLDISIGDVFPRKLMFSPTGSVSSMKLSSAAAAKPNSAAEREPIRVYCRVKPAPPHEQSCADIANGTSILLKAPHPELSTAAASDTEKADSFHFTGALSHNLTQEDVCVRPRALPAP